MSGAAGSEASPDGPEGREGADTADTMRERAGENRAKLWLLLRANRLVVAGVLTLAASSSTSRSHRSTTSSQCNWDR